MEASDEEQVLYLYCHLGPRPCALRGSKVAGQPDAKLDRAAKGRGDTRAGLGPNHQVPHVATASAFMLFWEQKSSFPSRARNVFVVQTAPITLACLATDMSAGDEVSKTMPRRPGFTTADRPRRDQPCGWNPHQSPIDSSSHVETQKGFPGDGAAKAGISLRRARRIESEMQLPS